jgi:hypothetical protein
MQTSVSNSLLGQVLNDLKGTKFYVSTRISPEVRFTPLKPLLSWCLSHKCQYTGPWISGHGRDSPRLNLNCLPLNLKSWDEITFLIVFGESQFWNLKYFLLNLKKAKQSVLRFCSNSTDLDVCNKPLRQLLQPSICPAIHT